MILLALFALVVALVPLCGGRLSKVADMELRVVWLLYLALGIQLVILEVLPAFAGSNELHLATYGLALLFLASNRTTPGVTLIALGALGNVAAIAANGGVMPASPAALRLAGLAGPTDHFANSAAVVDPKLSFLGDVFAIPAKFPLANVFSVGDVLLLVGGGTTLHAICDSRLGRRFAPGRAPEANQAVGC